MRVHHLSRIKPIGHFRHEVRLQQSNCLLSSAWEKLGQSWSRSLTDDVSLTGPVVALKVPQQIQTFVNFIQYAQAGVLALIFNGLGLKSRKNNQHRFWLVLVPDETSQLAYSPANVLSKRLFKNIESYSKTNVKSQTNEGMGVTPDRQRLGKPILGGHPRATRSKLGFCAYILQSNDQNNIRPMASWRNFVWQGKGSRILNWCWSPILAANNITASSYGISGFGAVVTSATFNALNQFSSILISFRCTSEKWILPCFKSVWFSNEWAWFSGAWYGAWA